MMNLKRSVVGAIVILAGAVSAQANQSVTFEVATAKGVSVIKVGLSPNGDAAVVRNVEERPYWEAQNRPIETNTAGTAMATWECRKEWAGVEISVVGVDAKSIRVKYRNRTWVGEDANGRPNVVEQGYEGVMTNNQTVEIPGSGKLTCHLP